MKNGNQDTIRLNSAGRDRKELAETNRYHNPRVKIRGPVPHDGADGDPLARDADAGPVDGDPADGKGQGRVDEEAGVAHVGARHGCQRRQLGQAQHDADDEAADGRVALWEERRASQYTMWSFLG